MGASVGSVIGSTGSFQESGGGSSPTPTLQIPQVQDFATGIDDINRLPQDSAWRNRAEVKLITREQAAEIIVPREWLGTLGMFLRGYGLFIDGTLGGAVSFAAASSFHLAKGICGPEYTQQVAQLVRGTCLPWTPRGAASYLISMALKMLAQTTKYRIVVAFADPRAGEIGTVYQAANALYVGLSARRTDTAPKGTTPGDMHYHTRSKGRQLKSQRGLAELGLEAEVWQRPRKHKYIWLLGTKTERRKLGAALRYKVLPYPKRS